MDARWTPTWNNGQASDEVMVPRVNEVMLSVTLFVTGTVTSFTGRICAAHRAGRRYAFTLCSLSSATACLTTHQAARVKRTHQSRQEAAPYASSSTMSHHIVVVCRPAPPLVGTQAGDGSCCALATAPASETVNLLTLLAI